MDNKVIRRKKDDSKFTSDSVIESYGILGLKRWATALKKGQIIKVNGPCEIVVRRVSHDSCDCVFILQEEVIVKKHCADTENKD